MGQEITQSGNEEISVFALLLTLNQFKKWVIGIPLVIMLIAAIVLFLQPDKYTAELKMSSTENTVLLASVVDTPELYARLEQQLKLIKYYQVPNLEKLTLMLRNNIKTTEKPNKIITVSVTDTDPQMAAKIANSYGKIIVDIANAQSITKTTKKLEQVERTLLYTRQLLEKNANRIRILGAEEILQTLPPLTRFAIENIANLQAEAAVLSDIDELTTKDTLRLADILSSGNQTIKPMLTHNQVQNENLYEAVTLRQSQFFLSRIEQRLLKRKEDLTWETTKDPQIIAKAAIPSTSSGPPRLTILLITGIISLVLTALVIVLITSFVRMKREYMQAKKLSSCV